ncbi:hypothetical protein HOY82DRAFT_544220 [Tuber indicum]|nr:hypothetical protein HOY82DRAFT_544220 [Tuber indicum]
MLEPPPDSQGHLILLRKTPLRIAEKMEFLLPNLALRDISKVLYKVIPDSPMPPSTNHLLLTNKYPRPSALRTIQDPAQRNLSVYLSAEAVSNGGILLASVVAR